MVRASHRFSSYSYSYSVKRYSYSMAVEAARMPIVDRGSSRELADQWAELLCLVASSTSTSTEMLSPSTRRIAKKVVHQSCLQCFPNF